MRHLICEFFFQEIGASVDLPSSLSGKGTTLQHSIDKYKHRSALAVRELQQAQQELWAIRGASAAGHTPSDIEQDLISLKKRVQNKQLNFMFETSYK